MHTNACASVVSVLQVFVLSSVLSGNASSPLIRSPFSEHSPGERKNRLQMKFDSFLHANDSRLACMIDQNVDLVKSQIILSKPGPFIIRVQFFSKKLRK